MRGLVLLQETPQGQSGSVNSYKRDAQSLNLNSERMQDACAAGMLSDRIHKRKIRAGNKNPACFVCPELWKLTFFNGKI